MHLIMDGEAKNVVLMTNRVMMDQWLYQTAEIAGMTVFGSPFVYGYPWPGSHDWNAITAFCPLMESGLSLHCWPERGFVFIDLFTCGEVTKEVEDRVIGHIVRTFQMIKPTIILLDRGISSKTGEIIPARLRTKEAGYGEARKE